MKIIQRLDRHEGDTLKGNALIQFGKKFDGDIHNGYYLVLRSLKTYYDKLIVCPNTFEIRRADCRLHHIFMCRRLNQFGKWIHIHTKVMVPIE